MGGPLFRRLLDLLPADVRAEYGAEMTQVVEEHWRDIRSTTGPVARVGFWLRQYVGVIRLGIALRLRGASRAPANRDTWNQDKGMTMTGLTTDLRLALRGLLRDPLFAGITVLTLALGIGASTTVFSTANAVLFRELPYAESHRIASVFHADASSGELRPGVSAANIHDLSENAQRLEPAAVAEPYSLDLTLEGRTESLRTWAVSDGFFRILGTATHLGRTFRPEEYVSGNEKVVVLGYRAWESRFGADPGVVGSTLILNSEPWVVVGVLPPAFRYPDRATAWIPRPPAPWDSSSRAADYMLGVARLAPGASLEQAREEARAIGRTLAETYPQNGNIDLTLVDFREHLLGDVRTPLLVLLAAVGFLLLIACANVAGLLMARGARRSRDYALRAALGAPRHRLTGAIAAETLVLAGAGCALGILLARVGVDAVAALGPDHLPRIEEMGMDRSVLLFAVAASAVSAILAGLAPMIRLSRPDVRGMLGDGSRGVGDRRANRIRDRLVVLQVGGALILLIGAGLLGKSFNRLLDQELGFDPSGRTALQVFAYDYAPGEDQVFARQVVDAIGALPGVTQVAITSSLPGANDGQIAAIDVNLPMRVEGRALSEDRYPQVQVVGVSDGYFETMGTPVVAGRGVLASDDEGAAPVAVVNEALARRHFPGQDPLGQRISFPNLGPGGGWTEWEIVGVVGDVRPLGFESEPRPEVYRPLAQAWTGSLTFVARTDASADELVQLASEAVWSVNPGQAVWGAATLDDVMADHLRARRFNILLLGGFAAVALVLASIGVYGLVSFSVAQRASELGIRRALGGRAADVVGMVLRDGTRLGALGVALGLVGAVLLSRFLEGMLFGVASVDPLTYALLGAGVLALSTLASLPAALRATRVDPMDVLRRE